MDQVNSMCTVLGQAAVHQMLVITGLVLGYPADWRVGQVLGQRMSELYLPSWKNWRGV